MHSESPIQFFCVICGEPLTVDADFAWSICQCPSCERNVPVPGVLATGEPERTWQPAFTASILSVEITFVCPGCDCALVADARSIGEDFGCPKCEAVGRVPDWSRAPRPAGDRDAPVVTESISLSAEEIDFLSGGRAPEAIILR